jgi:hypothetical protein
MVDLRAITDEPKISLKRSLDGLISTMMRDGLSYQAETRLFRGAYIAHVRSNHAGHLGRTAADLGGHHNTLTRTLGLLRRE